jgi:hypothetical protein
MLVVPSFEPGTFFVPCFANLCPDIDFFPKIGRFFDGNMGNNV